MRERLAEHFYPAVPDLTFLRSFGFMPRIHLVRSPQKVFGKWLDEPSVRLIQVDQSDSLPIVSARY